jgi:pyruvate dehydrogenase E1 component beta subunit
MYGVTFDISDEALSPDYVIPLGKAKVERQGLCLMRQFLVTGSSLPSLWAFLSCFATFCLSIGAGTDVTLVAFSRAVGTAMEAAEELAKEGISAEVCDGIHCIPCPIKSGHQPPHDPPA